MPPKAKEQTYSQWLASLKPGDRVKTSACNHNRSCNCKNITVSDIVVMFKEPAIVVQDGCTMMYYSQVNGKELGSRRGTYKNGNLTPYTEKDAEAERIAHKKDEEVKLKEQKCRELTKLLTGSDTNYLYSDIREHMSLEQIEAAVKKLTR